MKKKQYFFSNIKHIKFMDQIMDDHQKMNTVHVLKPSQIPNNLQVIEVISGRSIEEYHANLNKLISSRL